MPGAEDLGGSLSASRTAYREAIRFLAGKGLIAARPRSGTRVAQREHWNLLDPDVLRWSLAAAANEGVIRDLFEIRLLIEPGCARLAAERRRPEHLARLALALRGMTESPPYSDANIAADLDFHAAIFDASGNLPLRTLSEVVATTLIWSMRLQGHRPPDQFRLPLADHGRVYEAIAAGDGGLAEAVTRVLVTEALRDTLNAFRERRPGQDARAAE